MDLYKAMHIMKAYTAQGKTFSVTFATYDRQRRIAKGIRNVSRCKIRPQAAADKLENADYKIFLLDTDSNKPFTIWQPLFLKLDEIRIDL